MSPIKIEELFRVEYERREGDFIKEVHHFMKEIYEDGRSWYFRVIAGGETFWSRFTDSNAASDNIQEIIDYFEHCYKIDMDAVEKCKTITHNKKIHEIALYCANKTKEFLDKVKEVAINEATDNNKNAVDQNRVAMSGQLPLLRA